LDTIREMAAPADDLSEVPGGTDQSQKDLMPPEQVQSLLLVVKQYLRSVGQYKYGGKFQLHGIYAVEEVAKFLTSNPILSRLKNITHPLNVVLATAI
jgi:hypothetical protein